MNEEGNPYLKKILKNRLVQLIICFAFIITGISVFISNTLPLRDAYSALRDQNDLCDQEKIRLISQINALNNRVILISSVELEEKALPLDLRKELMGIFGSKEFIQCKYSNDPDIMDEFNELRINIKKVLEKFIVSDLRGGLFQSWLLVYKDLCDNTKVETDVKTLDSLSNY